MRTGAIYYPCFKDENTEAQRAYVTRGVGGLLKHIHFSAPQIKTSCELQLFSQSQENGRLASASLPRREQRQSSLSLSNEELGAQVLQEQVFFVCSYTSLCCQSGVP